MPEWVVTEDAGFFNGSPPRRVILLRKDDSHQDRRLADRPEGLSLQIAVRSWEPGARDAKGRVQRALPVGI